MNCSTSTQNTNKTCATNGGISVENLQTDGGIEPIFKKILESLIENARFERQEHYSKILEQARKLEGQCLFDIRNDFHRKSGSYFMKPREKEIIEMLDYGGKSNRVPLTIIPNIDNYIEKKIKRDIDQMFEAFIMKQTKKTENIIKSRKIKKVSGRVSSGLNTYLSFVLEDGSRFNMQCQIVWKVSSRDKDFWQFPTTFHDAYTSDGKKIERPSESSLKEQL